ncbi:MAG: mechanosensitive ion channel family protein [Candidatus Eremiobacterota bacterium]
MKFHRKFIIILIIILFSLCFFSVMARESSVPSQPENEPNNPSPSAHPSSKPHATQTPVVILPPVPVSTQIPVPSTPLPSATRITDEATVMLYYRPLFKIYSDSGLSASERAYILEKRLEEVLERTKTTPFVKVNTVDGTPVLESEGVYLISITNNDASYNKTSVSQLAALWRDELEHGLETALKEKSEDYAREAFRDSVIAIITGILISVISVIIWHRWIKRPAYFAVFLIWLMVLSYIFWVFPTSRSWAKGIGDYILNPALTLSVILVIINILAKPLDIFIKHYFDLAKKLRGHEIVEDARAAHRITMYRLVIAMFFRAGIYIIGGLLFLKSLHVDLATGLTGAGIIGVGIGLAAQDLLKDVIAGTFIVIEDQFAVGDVIRSGNFTGTVEYFNMRITRIRDMGGSLITMPNSSIRAVENFSSTWSQIDCIIGVAYDTDLKHAMDIMIATGKKLKEDHPEKILEDPVMLGVNELAESSVKLRMLLKTAPSEQWQMKRELFLRIKNEFYSKGIFIAFPQLTVWLNHDRK